MSVGPVKTRVRADATAESLDMGSSRLSGPRKEPVRRNWRDGPVGFLDGLWSCQPYRSSVRTFCGALLAMDNTEMPDWTRI